MILSPSSLTRFLGDRDIAPVENFLGVNDVARRRKRFTTERTENTEKTPLLFFSVNSVASVVNLLSMTERERLNGITKSIIGAAIQVHSALGPGLLESAYEACLAFELERRQLRVEQQKPLPLIYEQVKLDCGYRIDLLVEGSVVVEIKSVDAVAPIHEAQVITYLKLSGCKLALLINFNVPLLKDGIRRFVNGEI